MRAVVQRVRQASVTVESEQGPRVTGAVDGGLLVLLAVSHDDAEHAERRLAWLADKVANLRVFPDEEGRMNRSLLDEGLGALVVSQFTLYGDCRRGRRPDFTGAAPQALAEPLYDRFCDALRAAGVSDVQRGVFGATMDVALVNAGPVTLIVDAP